MANYDVSVFDPIQKFFRVLQPDKKDVLYLYIYAFFNSLIALSLPLGIQVIIGLVVGGNMNASVVLLISLITLATLLSGVFQVIQLYIIEIIQRRLFSRAAFDFAYRIPRFQFEKISDQYIPEVVNRFFETLTLQKGFSKVLMDFSASTLQIFFGLLLIAFYHPFYVFFSIILLLIVFIIFYFTGSKGLQTSLKESSYKYEVVHWLEELGRTMNSFKLSSNMSLPLQKLDPMVSNYIYARRKHFQILSWQYLSIIVFKTSVIAAMLLIGSFLVIDNQINIGQFVAAEIIIVGVVNAVEKLIMSMDTIYDVMTAVEKLSVVTDIPLESTSGSSFDSLNTKKGIAVQLERFSFQFEPNTVKVLDDISLQIKGGEKICISGYNDSGKSTLLKVLAGFYKDFQGGLLYNGIPLQNLQLDSLRSYIGGVSAADDVFSGTFAENITMNQNEASLQYLQEIAQVVGLLPFIQQQPKGFDTPIVSSGRSLPHSVVNKIMLARSLAMQPQLLLIEDLFSNLEIADLLKIVQHLTAAQQPWTLLIASNKKVIAEQCERILVMQNGCLIADAPSTTILKDQQYASLFH
ncbi:MAG: ATP-binding cassette domain-containing protein [Chitinophagales bacterium]|jgi:ABC-type bacteriocin/lantibiotic exporter with double-glycine peptidase domain|nr:ATP-binding cassette domain-containing protein [Chitinophagales bacterium]